MNHLELFSGIGGFRQAMKCIEEDYGFNFNCVGFSEINAAAIKTYCANYDTSNEVAMGDIVSFVSNENKVRSLKFDLLTGGFPCQSFSMMGQQKGFEDDRGTMFFQILKLLSIKKKQRALPNFIILENVKHLLTHDKGNTFAVIKSKLEELGYSVYYDIFNSNNFYLAQKRNRIIIVALKRRINKKSFSFNENLVRECFVSNIQNAKSLLLQTSVADILETEVLQKYYLSDRLKPTILADGSKSFKSKSEINQLIARPLTATMHKMHRACQDNYYSDGFIHASNKEDYLLTKFSKEELAQQQIRRITPEEAFMLQGFHRNFVENARLKGVSDTSLYMQAGNAVSVNVIYSVFLYLIKCNILKN